MYICSLNINITEVKKVIIIFLISVLLISCGKQQSENKGKLNIVTTTTMLTDLVKIIGGDKVQVEGLMGAGVDPHLYKASEGDVQKLFGADMVFFNGLHLEGKLQEVFEKMEHQHKTIVPVADALAPTDLIASEAFASNYDPHIWFNIDYWSKITKYVAEELAKRQPENKAYFFKNEKQYQQELKKLKVKLLAKIGELKPEQKILVTAHDAFNYFGKQFNFQVVGLQGLSTATEAGVKDVQELAKFIIKNNVKAIFVESSVPKRTIEALQASVRAKNHEVKIGGTLYSDALGSPGTIEGTYIGMYEYNVNTIVDALK